ncbi:MAG: NTP transferase domain-containing protein [Clostridiales bacterium]|nr:NTP transferase domain-containing protein [Clostridiales bacterium]
MLKNEFEAHYRNGEYSAISQYKVDNAVILAVGLSSRFAPLSDTTPKGLLKVKGEIMIERLIRQLYEAGIPEIYVVVGYKKELFCYLEEKHGVHLIENPDYAIRNNHSSIYAARDVLGNSYICPADHYFMENVFEPYVFEPFYSSVFVSGKSTDYCLSTNFSGRITHVKPKGTNVWRMQGHAYWNRLFSRHFLDLLEAEYDLPATKDMCWENIYMHHLDTLTLYIRKYPDGIVREFNNLEELCLFDTSYIPYSDSLKREAVAE